jgi:hypothetical protein
MFGDIPIVTGMRIAHLDGAITRLFLWRKAAALRQIIKAARENSRAAFVSIAHP